MIRTFNQFVSKLNESEETNYENFLSSIEKFLNSKEQIYKLIISQGKGYVYTLQKYFKENKIDVIQLNSFITITKLIQSLNENPNSVFFFDDNNFEKNIDIVNILQAIRNDENVIYKTSKLDLNFKFNGKIIY
jgi:hypothetical protein